MSNSFLFNQLGIYTKVGWGFNHAGVVVSVFPICIYTLFWLTSTLLVWLNWDNKIMILTCEACSGELTEQMKPELIRRKSSLKTSLTTRWTERWLGKNKHASGEQPTESQLLQINSPGEQDGCKQQFKIWKRNQANQTEENGIYKSNGGKWNLKKDKNASILTGQRLTAWHRKILNVG